MKLAAPAAKSQRNLLRPNSIQWRTMMNEQNPLWLIVGAMAIFFVAAAAMLAAI